jgi:hypothetical protein
MKTFDLIAIAVSLGILGFVLLVVFIGVEASRQDYLDACTATDRSLAECEFLFLNRP